MATLKLRRLPQPALRMKALPRFPARLQGGDGVTVTQSGGVFTFSLDPDSAPSFDSALPFTVGDLLVADDVNSVSSVPDAVAGNVLLSGGIAAPPAYGKVGLTTHVSGVLPAANGGTGLSALGAGVATFLGAPSSANLLAAVTDETGTGTLVFADNPTLTTSATIKSTDDGAATGPILSLFRDASPAANDLVGLLGFYARNSAAIAPRYAGLQAALLSVTSGSESAQLSIQTTVSGTLADRLIVANGAYMAGATGGDKGANTFNATTLYQNGVAARIRLSADTTFYADNAKADDTGSGLTALTAKKTVQAVIDLIAQNYDLAGYQAIVSVADGTYSGTGASGWIVKQIGPFTGGNPRGTTFPSNTVIPVLIRGNIVTPGSVIFTSSGSDTVLADAGAYFGIEGVRINNTYGAGSCLRTGTTASILFGNCILGAAGDAKVYAAHSSVIECYSNYWVRGDSAYIHKITHNGSILLSGRTETQLSDITVTAYASVYDSGSALSVAGMTFATGGFTFTGKKFEIGNGGSIRAGTNSLTTLPGSTKGTITWGSYDDFTRLTQALTINQNASASPIAPVGGAGLQIVSADNGGAITYLDGHGSSAGGIIMRRAPGTLASPTAAQSGDILGFIGGQGYGASGFPSGGNKSSILFKAAENFTNSANGALIEFQTTPTGSLASAARWTIAPTGGLYSANATGGDKGVNTVNALNYYLDGTAPTGTGALVRLDNPTITTALAVKSTDAGAGAGPVLSLNRDSASPAANDLIGSIGYFGRNSAAGLLRYAGSQATILDATSTSEDAIWAVQTVVAGTLADRLIVGQGAYTAGATGGDKGANTINASSYYIAGAITGLTKVITITRDLTTATGSVAYTGVGFKPTSLSASGAIGTSASYASISGFCDSALNQGVIDYNGAAYGNAGALLRSSANGFLDRQTFVVTSLDADGFTGTWTKVGSPTGTATYYILCRC